MQSTQQPQFFKIMLRELGGPRDCQPATVASSEGRLWPNRGISHEDPPGARNGMVCLVTSSSCYFPHIYHHVSLPCKLTRVLAVFANTCWLHDSSQRIPLKQHCLVSGAVVISLHRPWNVATQPSHEYAYPNLVHIAVRVAIITAIGRSTCFLESYDEVVASGWR